MKSKLHFGIVMVLLAFLVTFLEQPTIPNQQIVIQFSAKSNNLEGAEKAIEAIKNQLQIFGATKIKIGQQKDGQLTITYYSDAEVNTIQQILIKNNHIKIADGFSSHTSNQLPEEKQPLDYELNISKIKSDSSDSWRFDGLQVTERNQKTDQSNTVKLNASAKQVCAKQSNIIISVALLVNKNDVIGVGESAYQIPEVRAGPLS